MYYVYLLRSADGKSTYVGFTSKDPIERLKEHNFGSNEFTKHRGPWKLVYYETFYCDKCGRSRELFFKSGIGKKVKYAILNSF